MDVWERKARFASWLGNRQLCFAAFREKRTG